MSYYQDIRKGERGEMPRTYDQWRELANYHLAWRVTDDQAVRAVMLDDIAAKCAEMERKGQVASIWHAVHLVTGKPCQCGQCNPPKQKETQA